MSTGASTGSSSPPRLAVLASGTGSNLEAIIAADLPVALVLTDRSCHAMDIARRHNIPAAVIDRRRFGFRPRTSWDRAGFTKAVMSELQDRRIDLVAMAGFMTVLEGTIFATFQERILNTHPSLLPRFRGHDAVPQALSARVNVTGCTVHIATPALDSGRILAQATVPVLAGDTEASLHERIKTAERRVYPAAIRDYLTEIAPSP